MYPTEKLPVWSAGLLAAAISASPVFAEEHGFVEDSSLTLNTRQWYSHEIGSKAVRFRAQTNEGPRAVRDRTAWVQGFKLDYISGFTQGPLGFGLDFSTYSAVALERSQLQTAGGSNRVLVDKDGNVVDDWSKIGVAALKVKLAGTTVKVGRQQMAKTPVMGYADTRTLPASFDGVSLESHDIEGLTIKSGYFDRASPRKKHAGTKHTPRPLLPSVARRPPAARPSAARRSGGRAPRRARAPRPRARTPTSAARARHRDHRH